LDSEKIRRLPLAKGSDDAIYRQHLMEICGTIFSPYLDQELRSDHAGETGAVYGLRVLDVGCGGGLLSEPMARHGAIVVGVNASPGNISAAQRHAQLHGVALEYRLGEPADVLLPGEKFDLVMALEVVEHVSDMPSFLATAASHLAPGGMLFVSTIDRTWKSYIFAIVGAEYLLNVPPLGTHQWSMFVRPEELSTALAPQGLIRQDIRGMPYQPWQHRASWCASTAVNYIATHTHSATSAH
jgi:2-polyprenyl-6-hydroxyphenyl methylase/3-demethylubiquinone-9 3-methyltransferase